MTQDPLEILSALVDGEPVAPDVLAAALLVPGAREALVDFVRLKVEMRMDESRPSPRLQAAIDHQLGRPRRSRPMVWRALQGAAAAVLLALAALGASSLPSRFQASSSDEPPRAARVLRFTPGIDWHEGGAR